MNAQKILAARQAFTGDDTAFIAAANAEPLPGWKEAWITANTIRANPAMGGPAVAAAIYAALPEDQAITFASVGFNAATQQARDGVAALVAGQIITQQQAEAILATARVPGRTRAVAEFAVPAMTQDVLDRARQLGPILTARQRLTAEYRTAMAALAAQEEGM